MTDVYSEPLKITAEGGFVLVEGPGGIVATLTPAAAIRSGDALHQAGADASAQRGRTPGGWDEKLDSDPVGDAAPDL